MGRTGERIAHGIDMAGQMFFRVIGIIVRFAPIGAFGAMAFTVGAFGAGALINLGYLILAFYATSILFVLVVLGGIAKLCGFSIIRFIVYIKDELLIVLGTSSSETVLPQVIQKMQRLGCSKSVVGLVIPTGYSFNLDGTNIYMTLAILFLAQATNTPLSFGQELEIIGIAALTSKGASGVTGAGFITLAATPRHRAGHPHHRAGGAGRNRQVHERVPCPHQPRRQRRRDRRRVAVGGGARPGAARPDAGPPRHRRHGGRGAACDGVGRDPMPAAITAWFVAGLAERGLAGAGTCGYGAGLEVGAVCCGAGAVPSVWLAWVWMELADCWLINP